LRNAESRKQRVTFKGTRWLLLKNPWNLNSQQRERLSTLVRWNTPLVRAWCLKESFQLFWTYKQPWRAKRHLLKWMNSAMRSKLEPFKEFVHRSFGFRSAANFIAAIYRCCARLPLPVER